MIMSPALLTNNWPAMGLGLAGILFFRFLGMNSTAWAFAVVGGIMGLVAFGSDLTLGEITSRPRPLETASGPSFPSGHTFGSTVFFGFWGYLAVHYRLTKKFLIPVLTVLLVLILAVGFSRIFEQAHWPSDVAAGYLLGGLALLVLILFFSYVQRLSWPSSPSQAYAPSIEACETCRIEKSIASAVVLDSERGTATKTYIPPRVIRLLYWLAFQALTSFRPSQNAPRRLAPREQPITLSSDEGPPCLRSRGDSILAPSSMP